MATKRASENDSYNLEEVLNLLKIAAGNRSLRQFALKAGVSPSNIYRIKREDYRISPQMIRKFTSKEAEPQGNVSFSDLMKAAGYQDNNDRNEVLAYEIIQYQGEMDENKIIPEDRIEFEKKSEGIIMKTMIEKNIEFSISRQLEREQKHSAIIPDVGLKIKNKKILEWWIDCKYVNTNNYSRARTSEFIRIVIGRLMFINPNRERKISLAVNNEELFNQMIELKDQISYRGELSIILINTDEYVIEKEVYISHYNENDKSMEFYIDK